MHMESRHDADQGRRRTVVRIGDGDADLSVVIVASAAVVVFAASVVCAVELRGVPHVLAVVVAVVSGGCAALIIVPLVLFFAGMFVIKGLLARSPSASARVPTGRGQCLWITRRPVGPSA